MELCRTGARMEERRDHPKSAICGISLPLSEAGGAEHRHSLCWMDHDFGEDGQFLIRVY